MDQRGAEETGKSLRDFRGCDQRSLPAARRFRAVFGLVMFSSACASRAPMTDHEPPDRLVYSTATAEERALHAWELLRRDPTNMGARLDLGSVLVDEGYLPQAVDVLSPALEIPSGSLQASALLATVLRRGSAADLDRSIAMLEGAARRDPGNPAVGIELGYAYAQSGRDRRAIAAHEDALRVTTDASTHILLHSSLFCLYRRMGDVAAADRHLDAAREIDPDVTARTATALFDRRADPPRYRDAPPRSLDRVHPPDEERIERARRVLDEDDAKGQGDR